MMKRRDALKTIGGLGAAAGMARVLPNCGGGGGGGDDGNGSSVYPIEGGRLSDNGRTGITTYVYLMMENRSYDHFFGSRALIEGKAGDGLAATMSNPDLSGAAVAPWQPSRDQLCDIDPPHSWEDGRAQWNSGANDGFVQRHQSQHMTAARDQQISPMQYLVRDDVPVSYALADQYATADRWFCAVMGPTWPNRFYWHSASSGGLMANTLPSGGLSWPSIYHRLDAKGIDWGYYYGSIPVVPRFTGLNVNRNVHRFTDFLVDAKNGALPPVVYLDPAFNVNDDHPPKHPINGQELIATVYNALAQSPQWKNCLLVVTYDEHGGFFDHVSPPKTVDDLAAQGFDQLGFRVPTLVAGPYVKTGYVSSKVYEHCSALRELELGFKLDPLNQRTQAANDLSDFLDLDRLARGDWAKPIALPTVNPDDATMWPMNAICADPSLVAPHPILEYADAHPEEFAGLDLRAELPEYRRAIREFLAAGAPDLVR